jgi:hypothetical protein
MTSLDGMLRAGRIVVLGIFCTLLLQGCMKKELVCGVAGEGAPLGIYRTANAGAISDEERKHLPPGGCWTTPVSGAQGEAAGWLELNPTTGQPTGGTVPANATCIANNVKCRFPTAACTKVNGTSGNCKHSIFKGANAYNVAQACTCSCN